MRVPHQASRLFPEIDQRDLDRPGREEFVVTRLLQDGDSEDLKHLFSQISEQTASRIFMARAVRQIDRRNRAFWSLLLDTELPVESSITEALWTL